MIVMDTHYYTSLSLLLHHYYVIITSLLHILFHYYLIITSLVCHNGGPPADLLINQGV